MCRRTPWCGKWLVCLRLTYINEKAGACFVAIPFVQVLRNLVSWIIYCNNRLPHRHICITYPLYPNKGAQRCTGTIRTYRSLSSLHIDWLSNFSGLNEQRKSDKRHFIYKVLSAVFHSVVTPSQQLDRQQFQHRHTQLTTHWYLKQAYTHGVKHLLNAKVIKIIGTDKTFRVFFTLDDINIYL